MFLKSPIMRDGCIKAESSQNCLYILFHLEADDYIIFGNDFHSNFMPARGRNMGRIKQKVVTRSGGQRGKGGVGGEEFYKNYGF
uniref:Uncharacterized protein n=1 Tax=Romanomermis culicivorax TaxID=13658 RepID=A0A915JWG2_ROMCU